MVNGLWPPPWNPRWLSSTSTFTVQWICGHQEDHAALESLCFLAILNVDCDERAKAYLQAHHKMSHTTSSNPLLWTMGRHQLWPKNHYKYISSHSRTVHETYFECLSLEKVSVESPNNQANSLAPFTTRKLSFHTPKMCLLRRSCSISFLSRIA